MEIRNMDRRVVFPWIAAACVGLSSFAVKETTPKSYAQGLPATLRNEMPKTYVAPGTTDASGLVNQQAPDFSLSDVTGSPHGLSEWHGQVTVLNFWGFWCDTWKAELPYLKELTTREKELGFTLVAVSVDGTRMSEFSSHTENAPLPFPVLMDVGGAVRSKYGVRHVPTVVIIDKNGIVRYFKSGYPGNDAVLSVVRKLVSEPVT